MQLTRYINKRKYEDLLSTETLFFPHYDNLGDPYEGCLGHIPTDKLIKKQTERLRRIAAMPQQPKTLAREFLETFEPLLYHNFLRDFTFVNCWHQSEVESMPMWKMYAEKGIMIKSDLSSLKNSLGINAEGYQHSNVFQDNHGIDPSDGYEIFIEIDNVKYITRGNYIEPVGLDRYFRKQLEYADERELRVVLQLHLGLQQRFNLPYIFDDANFSPQGMTDVENLILQIWKNIKLSYEKHASILNADLSGGGVRCPVDINSLIKEVVVSPFNNTDSEVLEVKSLNREFGIEAEVKKSVIEIEPAVTKFSASLSKEVTIELEL